MIPIPAMELEALGHRSNEDVSQKSDENVNRNVRGFSVRIDNTQESKEYIRIDNILVTKELIAWLHKVDEYLTDNCEQDFTKQ